MNTPSIRADILTRRTYNRPLNDAGTIFETFEQTIDRVIEHQKWLWERAKDAKLSNYERAELSDLKQLMMQRKVLVSGRTLWLGGTDVAKTREASQFNCSHLTVETIHDVVDSFWLLLQGCGVGFTANPGALNGFAQPVKVEVIRSIRGATNRGQERNQENIHESYGQRIYHLTVGDSAEAWAKSVGKLLAMKDRVDRVVLDFSEVRPAGLRLKGYGWISSGDQTISTAFVAICEILSKRAGQLLTAIDIMDVMNWLGTTLSSRRSAEIALMDNTSPEINDFIFAKRDFFKLWNDAGDSKYSNEVDPDLKEKPPAFSGWADYWKDRGYKDRNHRQQSNNTVVFYNKPDPWSLRYLFDRMLDAGGSEPGFYNGTSALARAAWFKGTNPCGEILLGNRSFCNLVEVDLGKFDSTDSYSSMQLDQALHLAARANYRQTCVNLDDGILQRSWHETNEFLRLCGVGITGIVRYFDQYADMPSTKALASDLRAMRLAAQEGAHSMADELGMPRSKAVTTIKPSGTLGKIMDTTEGIHKPLGRYIFNNVTFSRHDNTIPKLIEAGYKVIDKPGEPDAVIVTLPVEYAELEFDTYERNGETVFVNLESAIVQLERYKLVMDNYVDHNCSITVSYDPSEIPAIVDWIIDNWDTYVGVSFILRNDPTKTAKDLGYLYLPQEVVTKSKYDAYMAELKPVDLDGMSSLEALEDDCVGGVCPIR